MKNAKEFNLARQAALAAPDIRSNRVSDVESRINAGEYKVSAADLARKILS